MGHELLRVAEARGQRPARGRPTKRSPSGVTRASTAVTIIGPSRGPRPFSSAPIRYRKPAPSAVIAALCHRPARASSQAASATLPADRPARAV
ncbi:Hypothetical protein A7982_08672 [Minicystis rosea]|nr:Hypothetical protein A7982_08672 [Minicystis rosea]